MDDVFSCCDKQLSSTHSSTAKQEEKMKERCNCHTLGALQKGNK